MTIHATIKSMQSARWIFKMFCNLFFVSILDGFLNFLLLETAHNFKMFQNSKLYESFISDNISDTKQKMYVSIPACEHLWTLQLVTLLLIRQQISSRCFFLKRIYDNHKVV